MSDAAPTPSPAIAAQQNHLQALTYGLIAGTGALSLIVCGLRLYARRFVLNVFGIDDVAVIVALVATQCFNGLGMAVVYYGCGRHIEYVTTLGTWLKLYYAAMCLYLYVAMFVKISLLLFLRRLFPKAWMQQLTLGVGIFLVLFTISGSLVLALQCSPPRAAFDLTVVGKCVSKFRLFQYTLYQAVLMFVVDIILLVAPVPILLGLNMPGRKIVALVAIFGTGIIACIAPIVRFSTLGYLLEGATDLTYDSTSSLYWMAIEFNLGLVAGSLSSLRPLGIFRRFGSSWDRSKYSNENGYSREWMQMGPGGGSSGHKSNSKTGRRPSGKEIRIDTDIVQSVSNESQERIIENGKANSGV